MSLSRVSRVFVALIACVVLLQCTREPAPSSCDPAHPCAADAYCAYTPMLCGKGKTAGTCKPRPSTCAETAAPACGCDGKVHDSPCAARAAGVDLAVNGGCGATLPGFIPCGPTYCDARDSYCEIVLSDVAELPTDHTCRPLPPTCHPTGGHAPPCDCFPTGTRCASFCGPVETGGLAGLHLTCRL